MSNRGVTRKEVLKLLGLGTLGGMFGSLIPGTAAARAPAIVRRRRPNILLIVTDQERTWLDLPASLSLPRRRALAERAVMFTNYHVNAVPCSPSRSVIYTGQHIQHTRVYDNAMPIPGRVSLQPGRTPTIGQMLKSHGYHTVYHGKWHLEREVNRVGGRWDKSLAGFGFDEYVPITPLGDNDGAARYGAEFDGGCAASSARWLETTGKAMVDDKPWFLAANFINPHDITHFNATGFQQKFLPQPFASETMTAPGRKPYTDDLGYELPASFPDDLGTKPPVHRAYIQDGDYFYGPIPTDDTISWKRFQNYYFNCLRDVDVDIGKVLDALERSGLADNTIIIFTSDHGEMGGAHGQRLKGPFVYRENLGVPLLISHPDQRTGRTTDALACAIDLAPTILSLAGVAADARTQAWPDLKGHDFSEVLSDPTGASGPRSGTAGSVLYNCSAVNCSNPEKKLELDEALFIKQATGKMRPREFPGDFMEFDIRSFLRGIYTGRYRFGRYFRPNQHHIPKDWATLRNYDDLELYDTRTDPLCMNNLAQWPELHQDLILDLNARLNKLIMDEVGGDDGSYMPGDPAFWKLGGHS